MTHSEKFVNQFKSFNENNKKKKTETESLLLASFTKQGELARECNSKTAQMGGEIK